MRRFYFLPRNPKIAPSQGTVQLRVRARTASKFSRARQGALWPSVSEALLSYPAPSAAGGWVKGAVIGGLIDVAGSRCESGDATGTMQLAMTNQK
jgi:hypothetical protein